MGLLFRRLGILFRGGRMDRELEEEMRSHLETAAEEMGDDHAARRVFGNPLLLRERSAEAWGWRWLEEIKQDLKYARRMLTQALGIWATTAIFSVVNGVLLQPLSYPEPGRLLRIYETTSEMGRNSVAYPNYIDWRRASRSFKDMGATRGDEFDFTGAGEPKQIRGEYVSANLIPVLGVTSLVGRNFLPEEDRQGAAGAGLMMQSVRRLWRVNPGFNTRQLLTAQAALSPTVMASPQGIRPAYQQLPGRVAPIPGVESTAITPAVPLSERDSEIPFWPGAGPQPPSDRMTSAMFYLVTPDYLRVMQIPLLRGRFFNERDNTTSPLVVVIDDVLAKHVFPGQDPIGKQLSLIVAGPVQVAGVVGHVKHWGLDADDTARIRDQIYFPFLQAPDKFMSGGVAGLLLSVAMVHGLLRFLPSNGMLATLRATPDWRILAFGSTLALATTFLFGFAPAWQTLRTDLRSAMQAAAGSASRGSIVLRKSLVAAQVVFSFVLVSGALLFAKTLLNLR